MCLSLCPSDDGLRAVHYGRLDPEQFAELESHLDSCPACSARLASLWNETEHKPPKALPEPCSTPAWVEDWLDKGVPSLPPKLRDAIRPGDIGRLGKYRLLTQLGEGASSVVYHGFDMVLERHVTLKVFRPGYGHSHRRRSLLRLEAKAIASIDDDLVVRIIDIGRDGSTRFLVHPFTDGQTLRQFLESEGGSLELRDSIRLAREITTGLASIHKTGICHRDLKPGNILVHRDAQGALHPRLIDLGISCSTRNSAGTRGYIAPEVEAGGAPSPAADAYSLGRVLDGLRAASRKPWPRRLTSMVAALVDPDPARRPGTSEVIAACDSTLRSRLPLIATVSLVVAGAVAAATLYLTYRLILNQ